MGDSVRRDGYNTPVPSKILTPGEHSSCHARVQRRFPDPVARCPWPQPVSGHHRRADRLDGGLGRTWIDDVAVAQRLIDADVGPDA